MKVSAAPTVGAGAQKAVVNGVGQCEYFATQAFAALSVGEERDGAARRQISTPGHNWVLVILPQGEVLRPTRRRGLLVLALGVPRDKCICPFTTFRKEWEKEFSPADQHC
jgi:hypothetical protein